MKIVKDTGLVPVKLIAAHPAGIAMKGDIIGVTPARAKAYINTGVAELVDIPEGIETETLGEVEAEVAEPVQAMTATETDWRKMKFFAKLKVAKDLGYEGSGLSEEVNAFLESAEAPAAVLVTEDGTAATGAPAAQ
jgi:hypothetical protein